MSKNTNAAATKTPADAKNAGPNKPQLAILAALAKAGAKGLTKPQLVAKSGVNTNWIAEYAGQPGEMVSDLVRGVGPLKLSAAKMVDIIVLTDEAAAGERVYKIKPAGTKALAAAEKAKAAK